MLPCPGQEADTTAEEAALQTDARKTFREKVEPFVENYCIRCHGPRPKGGINLKSALKSPGSPVSYLQWKKAVANVKVHDMPPEDARRKPSDEERRDFAEWVEKVKFLAPRDPGPYVMRRLSKVEYGNTLRDLYGINPDIVANLPEEVVGEGYLNSISQLQSELFLEIANEVVARVIAPKGKAPTKTQQRLFGNKIPDAADPREEARRTARSLATEAFRRPPSDSELDVLVDVFDLAQENQLDYTGSLGLMWKAILVSPQFLFITPAVEPNSDESVVRIDDYQLASRLSYLLWSSPPDAELLALAAGGKLHQDDVLRSQAERLLLHPRAQALFDSFGAQWWRINGLEEQVFDTKMFPQATRELREAMTAEARLFFESVIQNDGSVIEFVDSNYTFLNETLASLYGLEETIKGPEMRRVSLTNQNRGGILGMPATLASTSFPDRTSPVRRGVWVLEQVLGERVPPPPPDVPELEEMKGDDLEGLTLRQLTELHQAEATCANCHKVLDPIGFGLENFDAIGRWREMDEVGVAIDSAGKLPDGKAFNTPAELKKLLTTREADLARNMTERLMAHALGRQLEGYDEIVIDRLMKNFAEDDYRVRTIVSEVITSYLFTHRRIDG